MGLSLAKMQAFLDKSEDVISELWPGVVVVDGEEFAVAAGTFRGFADFLPGGERDTDEVAVRVRKSDLEKPWAKGTRVLYKTKGTEEEMRVGEPVRRQSEVSWYFRLESVDE